MSKIRDVKRRLGSTFTKETDGGSVEVLYANDVWVRGSGRDLILDMRLRHPDGIRLVSRVYLPLPAAMEMETELRQALSDAQYNNDEMEGGEKKTIN